MTNAYRGANHHTEMARKYTKLGNLEEILHAINQDSHWVIEIKINGKTAEVISGRDAEFDATIKAAIERNIAEQHRKIAETITESKGGES